ncbi:MAG: hypothetical protein EOP04_29520, partial [Proteobacteria bacterium]
MKDPKRKNPWRVYRKVSEPYPYRLSIETAEFSTRFLDVVERTKYPTTDDFKLVERSRYVKGMQKRSNAHYHNDRYAYHEITVLEDPDIVVEITHRPLSFWDLIQTRVAPFGFIGAETTTVRADRYWFSPRNFWFHDLNHIRRMSAYTQNYLKKVKAFSQSQKYEAYRKMESFSQSIQRSVDHMDLSTRYAGDRIREIRTYMKVLLFESTHETALNYDSHSLISDITKIANTPQPFEYMTLAESNDRLVNGARQVDGNLVSGMQQFMERFENPSKFFEFLRTKTITVVFIRDKALSLLSEVVNKLNFGFYDSIFDVDEVEFGRVAQRTPENVAAAAHELLGLLGKHDASYESLLKLASSRVGMEELYK